MAEVKQDSTRGNYRMSWEVMQTGTRPCECGSGTETYTFEIDNWNRSRSSTEIHCPNCRQKAERESEADRKREERRYWLLCSAQQLATDRYSTRWLKLFAGKTKKAAWQRYTGGNGYPSLGTFYQHVKHAGSLDKYLAECLTSDLEGSLRVLGIEDGEIKELLKEREQLWKPTSGPM
jgi:hypothetical protein